MLDLLGKFSERRQQLTETIVTDLDINQVFPNTEQPRKTFDEEHLRILSNSIMQYGVFSPILVKLQSDGTYQIISGECRWRASKIAGKLTIPAIIKNYEEIVSDEIALIENMQRRDLNPIDEAMSFKTYLEKYNVSQKDLALKVGKSRAYISTAVRLLDLGDNVIKRIVNNQLSIGQAKLLLTMDNVKDINALCDRIEKENLNVRQLEKIIKDKQSTGNTNNYSENTQSNIPIDVLGKQNKLNKLREKGLSVKVKGDKTRGVVTLSYFNECDLDKIFELLDGGDDD